MEPWCAAIGSCLSVRETDTIPRGLRSVVIRVDQFVRQESVQYASRLQILCEALELLSLALRTRGQIMWLSIVKLCSNAELETTLLTYPPREWPTCFELSFAVDADGDCASAVDILHDLFSVWRATRSELFCEARAAVLDGGPAESPFVDGQVRLLVTLQPPVKTLSDHMIPYLSAQSRVDTVGYYDKLAAVLQSLGNRDASKGPRVESVDMDFSNLETPPEPISRIRKCLGSNLPVSKLAIQLGYTWDVFDQASFVETINQSSVRTIDHLEITATTLDNYSAAFNSLPDIANYRHVELVDCVLYGYIAPVFWKSFQRVLMQPSAVWKAKKLTLRGVHVDEIQVSNELSAPETLPNEKVSGLESLAFCVDAKSVPGLMKVLPFIGSHLESLEIHVTGEQSSTISFVSVAQACPRLLEMSVQNTRVEDMELLPRLVEQQRIKWRCLTMVNVRDVNSNGVLCLARSFSAAMSPMSRQLTRFCIVASQELSPDIVGAFELALERNERLEYLKLGPIDTVASDSVLKFQDQPLVLHKKAFIGAMYPASSAQHASRTSEKLDTWNIAHIMALASLTRRRRIEVVTL